MIQLDWESPKAEEWAERLAACGRSTAFQSWSWGAASAQIDGIGVRRAYILKNGRPAGLLQAFEQTRLGIFTLGQIIRGPLFFRPVMPEDRVAVFSQFRRGYSVFKARRISIMPEIPDGIAVQGLMDQAGFHHVRDGYSTAWLDLGQSDDVLRASFRQNFRNQLRRAERSGLQIRYADDPRPTLARYDAHRKQAGFTGPSGAMLGALPDRDLLCLEARDESDGSPLAAVLFIVHGRAATYQVGWTSPAGRRCHAHNLLLWRALPYLREAAIQHLDLGGLEWNKAPGVAHFKAGLGGETVTLPGVFV